MVFSRKVICLFFLFYLPTTVNSLWAVSLGDKLAMLGYSDEEIANVVSGKRRFETIQLKYRMEMLGR